ncbi:hypothetical protein [Alteromonas gilva]|uniref:Uncharacterized protein n=1 Tax=Alteromonas gilva TaxID=2987522 RepID=A0ABT5L741_9ALTE|nr:hypothetical protein [Alteromonas gilva]MDC8832846.1 hypothetical protein [Alteromonas gilva]
MTISIEQAKNEAITMVNDSAKRGCMFSCSNMPDENEHDWNKGDPENPHTIANLVTIEGIEGVNSSNALSTIELHICTLFPQYE